MAAIPVNVLVPLKAGIDLTQIFVNVTIIYISVRYLKPNLCMMYALNHSIPSLVYIIFSAILGLTDLSGAGRTAFYQGSTPYVENRYNWANFVDSALSRYVANSYKVFATLMVLLTYISYVYPLFYAKIISKRYIFLTEKLLGFLFFLAMIVLYALVSHTCVNEVKTALVHPQDHTILQETANFFFGQTQKPAHLGPHLLHSS
ncbi:hypothetical protein L596_012109 [Steinernema carpocapsae]|uniref:7TM GPCR serpentine receptor class x (Srx) domain-containing protein n=1 Tax=Steinernema carpocapsae TaxID=34508 RepID=A0A4U5NW46_STECR|nr:hypothetical protein L596_012109 [Steinernema carpocapsae]